MNRILLDYLWKKIKSQHLVIKKNSNDPKIINLNRNVIFGSL